MTETVAEKPQQVKDPFGRLSNYINKKAEGTSSGLAEKAALLSIKYFEQNQDQYTSKKITDQHSLDTKALKSGDFIRIKTFDGISIAWHWFVVSKGIGNKIHYFQITHTDAKDLERFKHGRCRKLTTGQSLTLKLVQPGLGEIPVRDAYIDFSGYPESHQETQELTVYFLQKKYTGGKRVNNLNLSPLIPSPVKQMV